MTAFSCETISVFLFAFISPTLFFCANNTQFFTRNQIVHSLLISGVSGIAAGCVFSLFPSLPPYVISTAALGCFMLLCERMIVELLPHKRMRLFTVSGVFLTFSGLTPFAGLWPLLFFLILFALLSLYDLRRNWNIPKRATFHNFQKRHSSGSKSFTEKPDVFLLLLESFHSRKALDLLYSCDDQDTESFLRQNGFTIYDDIFSNKHNTELSLAALLSQTLDFDAPPETLYRFRDNGYKVFFFDTIAFLSSRYSEFLDTENAGLQPRHIALYRFAGPLFAQSRWLRVFAGGRDPFATTESPITFEDMKGAFERHLSTPDDSPGFHILHFGARHFSGQWYDLRNPANVYRAAYIRGAEQIREIVSLIMHSARAAGRNPLIVAIGDHGALRFRGSFNGPSDPESNVRLHGLDPGLLPYDFFSVLFAVRWGQVSRPARMPHSHVNVFRHICAALEGHSSPSGQDEPDISLLADQYVLARSGKPVSPWERWEESSSPTSLFTLIRPETPLRETMTQIRLAWSRKDFPLAESLVEKLERMPHAELRNNAPDAAAIFMASDRREKGLALMRDELARNPRSEELKLRLARLLIALKRPEDALEMSDGAPSSSSPQFLYEMARASWLCGRPDQAEDTLLRLWESGTQTPVRFKLQVSCLLILAMERRGEEPCSWLLHQMNALSEQDPLFLPMELQIIIQRLAAGDRPGAEERAWPLLQRAPYLFGLAFLLMDGRLQAGDFPGMEELMKIFHGSMSASPALFGQACCLARAGNLPLDPARTRAADSWLAETGASVLHTGCFSGKWYAARYSRTPHHGPGAQPPLSHYLTRTLLDLTSPNPLFDTRFYLGNCPHIFGYGLLPLLARSDTRLTSPEFDEESYKELHACLLYSNESPMAHALQTGPCPPQEPSGKTR